MDLVIKSDMFNGLMTMFTFATTYFVEKQARPCLADLKNYDKTGSHGSIYSTNFLRKSQFVSQVCQKTELLIAGSEQSRSEPRNSLVMS